MNQRLQRANTLVDLLIRRGDEASLSAFRESLIDTGQQHIVDKFFSRPDADSLETPDDTVLHGKLKVMYLLF